MLPFAFIVSAIFLTGFGSLVTRGQMTTGAAVADQSALMNIWNYKIERKVKTMIKYKAQDLAVWEEIYLSENSSANRRYYVVPPAVLIPASATCQYIEITEAYQVTYDIQLWEKDLPSVVVASLRHLSLVVREDQIHPLPFYQARVIWNNPEEQLHQLKLSTAWFNNLKQQHVYKFRVAAENNVSCQLLANTIRKTPQQFVDSIQLQFAVSAAKIDSKIITVKSQHIVSSQLVASLKNMPNVDGPTRYVTSNDYNKMLWQIANQVIASEVTSGDYVDDADGELSLKEVIAQMLGNQKQNTAQFDDKMWNSVFWEPLDARPDKITNELNKHLFINQTDHRTYLTQSATSASSAKAKAAIKFFGFEAGGGGGSSRSSSSGMTTDDISHLLTINNIESQVQGEKFVPKQLVLTRLNVNDFSRNELLTTKRIRVRQVEVGGVLQVGLGNDSKGATDDENRYLRQQLNDLNAIYQQTQGAVGTLTNDVGVLKSQAANIHVYACTTHTSAVVNIIGGDGLWRMSSSPIVCPDGKFLKHWNLAGSNEVYYRYDFTCC